VLDLLGAPHSCGRGLGVLVGVERALVVLARALVQLSPTELGVESLQLLAELGHVLARLRALSPAATLERGYAIVQRAADGTVLRDPSDVEDGEELRVRLARGDLTALGKVG